MESPIITLTTDWGSKDFFVGMVKGRLLSGIPDVRIVDITHEIEHYNLTEAAFVVKHGCLGFPKGTIHIIDVNALETINHAFVAIQYKGQYFICTDDGLPMAVFGNECDAIVQLNLPQNSDFFNFAAYHVFCNAATLLAKGTPIEQLGVVTNHLCPNTPINYIESSNALTAYVVHIDAYGNAYLNISLEEFERIRNNRKFEMSIRNHASEKIGCILPSYEPTSNSPNGLVLTVSATGLLEVALYLNSVEQMLALDDLKRVEFKFL